VIFGLVVLAEHGPGRVFAKGPAVAVGRVSYGFYLWHLPVLRWTDDRLIGKPAVVRISVGLTLAAIATVLSYQLLELPALRLKRRFAAPAAVAAEPAEADARSAG
jgi:peptidoglycan/LPS O-acetylase OafA/YrhL